MAEFDPSKVPAPHWPTGWTTLIGLVIGAVIGWVEGQVPTATTAGLAIGVGIDSLMNRWLNEVPAANEVESAETARGGDDGRR
ncbi:MAG TPA: hypothetical protein VMT24_19565 [Aggregatilineaceae bacterium]|jgi:hypothetical protein|nr:hypothetical protein [Aggregatilineaceae bacterium]